MASTDQVTRELPEDVEDFHSLPGQVENVDTRRARVTLKYIRCTLRRRPGHPGHRHRRQHLFFRGFLESDSGVVGIVGDTGRLAAAGLVDLPPVKEADWFALPPFRHPDPLLESGAGRSSLSPS